MNCTQCNTPLTDAFCPKCGAPAPIDSPSAAASPDPAAPAPIPSQMPGQVPPASAPGQVLTQPAYSVYPTAPQPQKQGKAIAILVACMAVVVILVVVLVVAVFRMVGSVSIPSSPVTYNQFYSAAEATGFEVYDLTDPAEEISYLLAEIGDSRVDHFESLNTREATRAYEYISEEYTNISTRTRTRNAGGYSYTTGKSGGFYTAVLRMENTILVVEAYEYDLAEVNALLSHIGIEGLLIE